MKSDSKTEIISNNEQKTMVFEIILFQLKVECKWEIVAQFNESKLLPKGPSSSSYFFLQFHSTQTDFQTY